VGLRVGEELGSSGGVEGRWVLRRREGWNDAVNPGGEERVRVE